MTDGGGCEQLRESAASLYRFLSIQLWMNRDVDDTTWKNVPPTTYALQTRLFDIAKNELGRGCRLLQVRGRWWIGGG